LKVKEDRLWNDNQRLRDQQELWIKIEFEKLALNQSIGRGAARIDEETEGL
jgi:hypothetical protein